MAGDTRDVPQPQKPPEVGRELRFHLLQKIGVPLLAVVPILAMFSVFGTTRATTTAEHRVLHLQVTYPERLRYKTSFPLDVAVRNQGESAMTAVRVRIDRRYLEGFSSVSFTPAPQTITSDAYVFDLGEIPPGDAHRIAGTLHAERYWRHAGRITAQTGDGSDAAVGVATFTFP